VTDEKIPLLARPEIQREGDGDLATIM